MKNIPLGYIVDFIGIMSSHGEFSDLSHEGLLNTIREFEQAIEEDPLDSLNQIILEMLRSELIQRNLLRV